ncbi:MAG: hypothetical protein LBC94_09785 [Desulfovibrio sp.]|jgi:hypothetical protein|nr:hypothetical protein [Desulfovibrio sp.]
MVRKWITAQEIMHKYLLLEDEFIALCKKKNPMVYIEFYSGHCIVEHVDWDKSGVTGEYTLPGQIAKRHPVPISQLRFNYAEIISTFKVGQNTNKASPHPGSNKDVARVQATRRACEAVITGIGQRQHGFQVNGEYKTNFNNFRQAVQATLGDVKAHLDTVREEWKNVHKDFKHLGRVPEQ